MLILYGDVVAGDDGFVSGTLVDDGTVRTGVFRSDVVLEGIWYEHIEHAGVRVPFVRQ